MLHRYIEGAVCSATPIVDLDYAGMIEGRSTHRFAPETLDELLVVDVLLPQDLERHLPTERVITGQIHLRHAPVAQKFDQGVAVVKD